MQKGEDMITFENTCVMNMKNAVMGARNPMNSWARMDSSYDEDGNFVSNGYLLYTTNLDNYYTGEAPDQIRQ